MISRMGRVVKACAAAILSSLCVFAGIRPSFYLESCVWNATEILVLAPTGHAGSFKVVETIKGYPQLGAMLELDGLRPTSGATGKLRDLTATDIHNIFDQQGWFQGIPPIREGDRVMVFLRGPGAPPEWSPNNVSIKTDDWQPANNMGDLQTSAIWIQDGSLYGFLQTMNPGPTHLVMMQESEAQLRKQIQAVMQLRDAMDRAVVTSDPVERSRQLTALFRSGNVFARASSLQKLARGGEAGTAALLELLTDQSLLGWHQDILGALVEQHVLDDRFGKFLSEEADYWSTACRMLRPGWWTDMTRWPEVEIPRHHYTRSYALLRAIYALNVTAALPVLKEFDAVWAACPPLEPLEKTNQVKDELKLVLGTDGH
jgi:hypothetical protein